MVQGRPEPCDGADIGVEDRLRALLAVECPDDAVLGEGRGQPGASRRRWIVDGIDGTVEFAAGTSDVEFWFDDFPPIPRG